MITMIKIVHEYKLICHSVYEETKFKEAASFYEAIIKKNYDNVS